MNPKPKCVIVTGRAGAGAGCFVEKAGAAVVAACVEPRLCKGRLCQYFRRETRAVCRRKPTGWWRIFSLMRRKNSWRARSASSVEAAFQHPVWEWHMPKFIELGFPFIIVCTVDRGKAAERHLPQRLGKSAPRVLSRRQARRRTTRATGETGMPRSFTPPNSDVPTLVVSTENEYSPELEEIILWIESQNFATV